jgi:hypothetical protein
VHADPPRASFGGELGVVLIRRRRRRRSFGACEGTCGRGRPGPLGTLPDLVPLPLTSPSGTAGPALPAPLPIPAVRSRAADRILVVASGRWSGPRRPSRRQRGVRRSLRVGVFAHGTGRLQGRWRAA